MIFGGDKKLQKTEKTKFRHYDDSFEEDRKKKKKNKPNKQQKRVQYDFL